VWPITGSTAARRFISRRIGRVARRTWPVIHTRNFSVLVVAAVALVDVDATGLDPGQFFEINDDRPQGVSVKGVAVQRLGVQHELAALGLGCRGADRHLAAKLVGRAGFALADAFNLGACSA